MSEIIKLTNIYKSFDKKEVLNGASLVINQGEFLGIMGESGCGKSTLARIALGLCKADSGQTEKCRDFSARLIYQNPWEALDPSQTIGKGFLELLKQLSKEKSDSSASYCSVCKKRAGKKCNNTGAKTANYESSICDMLEKCGLKKEILNQRPISISGGEAARVCIARALFADPKLLVMDEACSMLDEYTAKEIIALCKRQVCDKDGSVVFISHDKNLLKHCDRVLHLKNGVFESI